MTKEIQVLFLDDEESILDGIQRLFYKEKFGIFTTTKVDQARETLSKNKIKVVVSDQRMPDIQGVKFLQEVKAQYPDIVRILVTGHTDFSAAEEAINMGEVYRFISKPWSTTELLSTIRQSIEHYDLIIDARTKKEELEIANKSLEAIYKMQREFTSMVSHELRTPLASIKMAIDLVAGKMAGEINKEQEDVLGRAKKNVDRLKRLINDILHLTKIEFGKLQMNFMVNDICQVIQEVAEAQKIVAQNKGLYFKTELDATTPKFLFDNDRVVQVLNNLISNAIKFTKQGGITIILKTRNQPEGNHIIVSILDTGKGISEEDMSKLFQKFQQLGPIDKNEEGGTGLGLAICKEIISSHGGKIWAESKLGEGTAFHFVLPLEERRALS